jgi:hypothetical protein
MKRYSRILGVLLFALNGLMTSAPISAEDAKLVVKPVAEKKVKELPSGPLYWRLENFPTLAQAEGLRAPRRLRRRLPATPGCSRLDRRMAPVPVEPGLPRSDRSRPSVPANICCA